MEFNSNLNNLYKNFQQQQMFNKKAFDVDGDKKVDKKKDQAALTEQKTSFYERNFKAKL